MEQDAGSRYGTRPKTTKGQKVQIGMKHTGSVFGPAMYEKKSFRIILPRTPTRYPRKPSRGSAPEGNLL